MVCFGVASVPAVVRDVRISRANAPSEHVADVVWVSVVSAGLGWVVWPGWLMIVVADRAIAAMARWCVHGERATLTVGVGCGGVGALNGQRPRSRWCDGGAGGK